MTLRNFLHYADEVNIFFGFVFGFLSFQPCWQALDEDPLYLFDKVAAFPCGSVLVPDRIFLALCIDMP